MEFLRKNKEAFAWSRLDMPGIKPEVITHQLNIDPNHKPVHQKRRKFKVKRSEVINEEVCRLLEAEFIKQVECPDWLANVVVVLKKNGQLRVCVDFTNLNKACLKDSFSLPHIDRLVDALARHELLTFVDKFFWL